MLLPETLKLHDQTQFELHYIYFLPWKNQMVEEIEKHGGKVTCLAASNNVQIMLKLWAVIKYIKRNNIHLIHCHLPWAGMMGRLVYLLTASIVIYTEHNKQERYHSITRCMNKITFNWQSCVIAVSKDVGESIKKNIKVRIPIHHIVNGVNTKIFKRDVESGKKIRQQLDIPEDACIVGTIAVFRFQKRLKEWLEIVASVSEKYPQLYGVIVGDGPLKDELVQHIKKLGIEKKILLPGLQTDVKPWLSAMDVFMMSSIFEGMPVALLEAMSMECVIVTTNAGGIKEVVQHKKNGLMVEVDHWRKLQDELILVFENEGLRRKLSEAARTRVEHVFGMERMVNELENLYFTIASK